MLVFQTAPLGWLVTSEGWPLEIDAGLVRAKLTSGHHAAVVIVRHGVDDLQ